MIADLDLLGVPLRIMVDDPVTGARLAELLEAFPRSAVPPDRTLSLRESSLPEGLFELWEKDRLIRKSMRPFEAVAMLLWHVNQVALETLSHVLLHAGCVALNGHGIILSAPMEAGKSTLVTHLVVNGFNYLSDEFAAVALEGRRVHPYPCPITLDPGSFALFPGIAPELPEQLVDPARWHVRAADLRPGSGSVPVTVRAVVLPRYEARARCNLNGLSQKQALYRLVNEALNLRSMGGMAFSVLSRVVRAAPTFTLEFSDLNAATCSLRSIIEEG